MMPDQSIQRNLTIVNTGNGSLDFSLEKEFEMGGDAEPWELRQTINAGEQCEDNRLQGVEFASGNFYVTGGNNGEQRGLVHIFSREGEYIRSYDQFRDSFWGMRDLTFDGQLLWSGDETSIYGFTPEGELVEEFDGPFDVNRSIAWDEDRQLLWVCDIGTEIIGVDRDGHEVATLPVNESFDIFGMAYYPEDSSDCNLYAFGLDVMRNNLVYKINPNEEEWIFVTDLEMDEDMMAGGLCITGRWDPMSWVFVGLTRGRSGADDELGVWHLSTRSVWFDFDQDEGVVEADGSEVIPITFNSAGFPVDIELTADLIIRHNGRGDDVTIPIILRTTSDGIEADELSLPTVFALDDPYPNPFNQTVRIGFSLPNECDVRLELFDLTGRRVKSLLDGWMTAGRHSISFHSTDLAGGMYLLRLKNDSQQSLCKIVLMK